MKRFFTFGLFLLLMLFIQVTRGQGLENFANYPETQNAYHDGTFVGQDGSTWTYKQCRGDSVIVAPSPTLGKNRTPPAEILSGSIAGGIGTFNFDYKQPFTTSVNLDVYVNGLLVGTVTTSSGQQGLVVNSGTFTVNTPGSFTFDFKQHDNATSGQVTVDNISWTGYSGGTLPEPTNYPTNFAAATSAFTITLNWTDATGAQLPTAYLVRASSANNIPAPVDGTPVPNQPDLTAGSAAVNVMPGVQTCTFANLPSNTPYWFKIFPYTNSGSLIDYKTDGTPPNTTATTPNTIIINSKNFNDRTFDPWTTYNVNGTEVWVIDTTHGVGNTPCGKMSGYTSGNHDNEDWLISPALDFSNLNNTGMTFMSASNYTGDPLTVKISNNYSSGDPTTATWADLTATLSAGGWSWTPSGNVNLAAGQGSNVHVAFKYTSTTTGAMTWELDDIVITGETLVGVPQVNPYSEGFSVYPNPTSGNLKLSFSGDEFREVSVISVLGNTVYTQTTGTATQQIDLSGLNRGVYFIQVKNSDGTRIGTRKIILK
jgi:hypothetical protein